MILQITDKKYLASFVDIYNSAIELFEEKERGAATEETFVSQLENDVNLIDVQEDGKITAFLSYHQYGKYYELTSLYVRKESQRSGVGYKLLNHFEHQVQQGEVIFVKVLKNAPWSLKFYRKYGYQPIDAETREIAETLNIREKPWSTVLFKMKK